MFYTDTNDRRYLGYHINDSSRLLFCSKPGVAIHKFAQHFVCLFSFFKAVIFFTGVISAGVLVPHVSARIKTQNFLHKQPSLPFDSYHFQCNSLL